MSKRSRGIVFGFCIAMLLVAFVLFGRRGDKEPISKTEFHFDTVVTITIYDSNEEALLDGAMDICEKYDRMFSRTRSDGELYQCNEGLLQNEDGYCNLSKECIRVLEKGLEYGRLTDGAFDLTIGPVSSLWDFSSGKNEIPDGKELKEAVSTVDYKAVEVKENKVRFQKEGMKLEFGAIAKGAIADEVKNYLVKNGVKSAIINLGGNVLCVGERLDGEPFRVGIQKPFAKRNDTLATIEIKNRSVVSSGIYERYFEKDGKFYHHILNPKTGYPCENDLVSVTILSDKSIDGDALSTACFVLGKEKGMQLVQSIPDVQAIFVTTDHEIHLSDGFEESVNIHYEK